MAKPIDRPGPSTNPSKSTHPPPHPRHRQSKSSSSSSVASSSGLLSLLATFASASTAYAVPAPPSFLCPCLELPEVIDVLAAERRAPPPETPLPRVHYKPNKPTTKARRSRYVPDKFVRGPDGTWRRVDSYTLYGSTVPSNCTTEDCRQPANVVTSIDDQIQVPNGTNSTNTTTPAYDIQLPPGWKVVEKPPDGRTTIILAMSLVLAFLICFFMIGCLFWRKSQRKKNKYTDVEAKARRRRQRPDLSPEEMVAEKEAKAIQKVWAKATARWKENVRYSARQRRGKRMSTRLSQAHQSTTSLDDSRSRLAGSRSRNSSRRSSTLSIPDALHTEEQGQQPPEEVPQTTATEETAPPTPRPRSPPAYQHRNQIPPAVVVTSDGPSASIHEHTSTRSSPASIYPSIPDASPPQHTELFPPSGHIATDDKAMLARLAELASAPAVEDAGEGGASLPEVSAPAWQDEELDDLLPPQVDSGTISDTPSPSFPPPPSKERLAAAERLEYTFGFDDLSHEEPEPEPSAPPFEEASAPPLDESLLLPSAPPLTDDEDAHAALFSDSPLATSPEWHDSESHAQLNESLDVSGLDHDRLASSVDGVSLTSPGPSSNFETSRSEAQAEPQAAPLRPTDRSPVSANDGITLPGYHP